MCILPQKKKKNPQVRFSPYNHIINHVANLFFIGKYKSYWFPKIQVITFTVLLELKITID